MSGANPFAALVDEEQSKSEHTSKPLNSILEDVFGFSLNKTSAKARHLIYLDEVEKSFKRNDLDLQVLEHALFDRLFMCNDEDNLVNGANEDGFEREVVRYLYNCYRKCQHESGNLKNNEINTISSLIIQNAVTALIESDIYIGQKLPHQLFEILQNAQFDYDHLFFEDICKACLKVEESGENVLNTIYDSLVMEFYLDVEKSSLDNFNFNNFTAMKMLTSNEDLAGRFVEFRVPSAVLNSQGAECFSRTALGVVLNLAILPKSSAIPYRNFVDPTDAVSNSATEGILWSNTERIIDSLHSFFFSLLTLSPEIKSKTLKWMGECLQTNAGRRKLFNQSVPPMVMNNQKYDSDGFMVNFGNVLLRLCQPFCSNDRSKILKVDPTYCAVPNDQIDEKGIHISDLSSKTCLIPSEDLITLPDKYNFVTECFYFAHVALELGYQVVDQRLTELNHDLAREERRDMASLTQNGGNSELADFMKKRMNDQLVKYLNYKAQLSDPNLLKLLFDFVSASSYWLCQVVFHIDYQISSQTFAPLNEIPIVFPLPNSVPNTLKCIPEFIVQNIACYLVFLKHYSSKVFEEQDYEKLKPILTFTLIFMGSSERMKNPHLRAELVEALEALLPYHNDENPNMNTLGGFKRELLFIQYEHRDQIVSNILNVFVGIEVTGESVEFAEKFKYRRPMYLIMHYLWTKEEYQECFKVLAEEAEKNMEAVCPPIFLRFVNLLINDAVHLLDEALESMAKLREMEAERSSLPVQERVQNMNNMIQIGMTAKFDNIIGRDTIRTLEKLTSKIKIVFTHTTIVDRVAAMLNYFLYNLVGPKKKNFKVKDQKKYGFEPAAYVLDICKIYINLNESETFCLAVSQDGRSYSPELFILAEGVLVRIGGGSLISELREVAKRVAEKAQKQQANEETFAGAPEHFFDPIMSTLMVDPVILPSSKQTVDRTTIARHLLSDQTDPFNRAPLSMEQVIPNSELAEEIKRWMEERRMK